jgi:hypothetical protein
MKLHELEEIVGESNNDLLTDLSKFIHFYTRTNRIKRKTVTNELIHAMYCQFMYSKNVYITNMATVDITEITENKFKFNVKHNYGHYNTFNFNVYYLPIYLIPIFDIFMRHGRKYFVDELCKDYKRYYANVAYVDVFEDCLGSHSRDSNIVHALTIDIMTKNLKYLQFAKCLTYGISIYDL